MRETGLDETQYFWTMPENRLELWAWLESGRLSDVVPREFYKERDVVHGGAPHAHRLQPHRRGWWSSFWRRPMWRTPTAAAARLAERGKPDHGDRGDGLPQEVLRGGEHRGGGGGRREGGGSDADAGEVLQQSARRPQAGRHDHRGAEAVCGEVGGDSRADAALLSSRAITGPSYRDPDDAVYDAISDILSNGRVSRLYRSLVRDQQIAAEAEGFSGFPGEKYPSLFAFYAVPLPGHTPAEMREAIHKEIDKLKTTDVTDAELQMYKTRARADLLRGLADNQGLASALAEYQTRYGDWRELFLQLDKVDKVTKADIRRVANKVFVAQTAPAPRSTPRRRQPGAKQRRRAMKNREQGSEIGVSETEIRDQWKIAAAGGLAWCTFDLRALGALAAPSASRAQQSKPWEKIPIPPLHEFNPQQPKRIELKNGIVVFLAGRPRAAVRLRLGADSRRVARRRPAQRPG